MCIFRDGTGCAGIEGVGDSENQKFLGGGNGIATIGILMETHFRINQGSRKILAVAKSSSAKEDQPKKLPEDYWIEFFHDIFTFMLIN